MQEAESAKQQERAIDVYIRTTITIPSLVHAKGTAQARQERRSFSNYLTTLVEADAGRTKEAANA